jgi:L,D-peptidoglycan transpeptidase YkuD (ErfK/YbiS/YcfS/YnhG family)
MPSAFAFASPSRALFAVLIAVLSVAGLVPPTAARAVDAPSSAGTVPAAVQALPLTTRQAVRVTRTNRWCSRIYCTQVHAWQRNSAGQWNRIAISSRALAVRSQIGPAGFAPAGRKRQGDMRTPTGVYRIATTFSVGPNPGTKMPWRQRLATTTVSNRYGRYYNTWIQERGRTDGTRPAMRYGLWVAYNNPRLTPGVGPAPVRGLGSGIFFHVGKPGYEYQPSEGCVQLPNVADMKWLMLWLDPKFRPRILLNR